MAHHSSHHQGPPPGGDGSGHQPNGASQDDGPPGNQKDPKDCVDNGILVISAGPNTVRFIPPLIVGTEEIDMAVEAVAAALEK